MVYFKDLIRLQLLIIPPNDVDLDFLVSCVVQRIILDFPSLLVPRPAGWGGVVTLDFPGSSETFLMSAHQVGLLSRFPLVHLCVH